MKLRMNSQNKLHWWTIIIIKQVLIKVTLSCQRHCRKLRWHVHGDYVGPEPALGLSLANIKHEISQWSVQEQNKRWRNTKSCRQAKQFMQAVNIRLTQYAVRLSRKDLRLLVGLLTGHNTLNRHLTLLRRMSVHSVEKRKTSACISQATAVPSLRNDMNSLEGIS